MIKLEITESFDSLVEGRIENFGQHHCMQGDYLAWVAHWLRLCFHFHLALLVLILVGFAMLAGLPGAVHCLVVPLFFGLFQLSCVLLGFFHFLEGILDWSALWLNVGRSQRYP